MVVMLDEIRQTQKGKHCMIDFSEAPRAAWCIETERMVGAGGWWGAEDRESGSNRNGVSVLQDEKSSVDGGDGCTAVWTCFPPLSCTRKND